MLSGSATLQAAASTALESIPARKENPLAAHRSRSDAFSLDKQAAQFLRQFLIVRKRIVGLQGKLPIRALSAASPANPGKARRPGQALAILWIVLTPGK